MGVAMSVSEMIVGKFEMKSEERTRHPKEVKEMLGYKQRKVELAGQKVVSMY